jgi:hypothetical protein
MRVRLVDKPEQTQSQIILGRAGVSVLDPDWLAGELVAYSLGEGAFSSRLMKVVRAEGGKTYGADAGFETSRVVGAFRARTATRNAETMATLRLVVEEIAKMKALGPTADELAAAQANLGGAHVLGLQNGPSVARAILSAETLGLGEAFVRELPVRVAAVTLEQAKAAARDNLSGEDLVVVIVGRASEVAPQLAKIGLPVETFSWLDSPSRRDKKPSAVDPIKAAQAKQLLDAALAAKGGEARLRGLKDVIGKGTVKIVEGGRSHEGPFVRFHAPGQALRLDVKTPKGKLAFIVTAAGAWIAIDDRLAQELPRELSAEQFAALWRDRDTILLRHLEADVTAEATGREKVAGKDYDVVVLKRGDLSSKLFLDPKTHLLHRMEYRERNATQIEEYRDYRAVQGIQFAFRQHGEGAGQVIDAVTSEIQVNAGIPAGTFDKPPK